MYETFSVDYDRFVNWDERLAAEMPFIERALKTVQAHRVLDTACGTGMHAIALASKGYAVVGTDASGEMIDQARTNATAGLRTSAGSQAEPVEFVTAGFGRLAAALGIGKRAAHNEAPGTRRFDALLCLGNSLPHVLTAAHLDATLEDFANCLRPGGLLLLQNRNFDAVLAATDRWMGPQGHREGATEWLFLRFYDFDPDGLLTFNMVRLRREEGSAWRQQVGATRLWPLTEHELLPALRRAGFDGLSCLGDMRGAPFDPETSPNLVVSAYRSGAESGQIPIDGLPAHRVP